MSETEAPVVAPAEPDPPPARRPVWRRLGLGAMAIAVAVIAGLVVSGLSIDLGPYVRTQAEVRGSKLIERPIRIGRVVAKLIPGVFEVHDLVIEGLAPADRPFLVAKRIRVALPWWSIVTHRLTIDSVEMTDWTMLIETWPGSPGSPGGRHNFPKFQRERSRTPSRFEFTTTLRSMLASRGQVTYEDHGTPWSIVTREMRVSIYRGLDRYLGAASFADSTIRIQSYEPFRAEMASRFRINGGQLHFDRIDLLSDGARSVMDGDLDMTRWPEQIYRIRSEIDFPTQKQIFFHGQNFTASGTGDFRGTFHLFKGGRELKGTFTSPLAGVTVAGNDWRFPKLRGAVLWVPDRLEVTDTRTLLYGGTATFDYRLAPFGRKDVPTRAVWEVAYQDVDLAQLTDFLETRGLRLAGRATGRNRLEWPLGKWALKTGSGEVTAVTPPGVQPMTRELSPVIVAARAALPQEAGPFNSHAPMGHLPIAGHITYALDPTWITLAPGWTATEKTYVNFEGRTAYGDRSAVPFHVTSLDWQESDRVLAGIMTAFGSPTGAIPVGGVGEFDGVLLNAFARPRIEGRFTGEHMRAWDVDWGRGRAQLVIENGYAIVSESVLSKGDSEITADGTFSLGYPRKDNGEEINARVRLARRPLADLRHAFELDDYAVEGVVSGEYHVYGRYEGPLGFGRLVIDKGVAYGEPFETATASLRFEGTGVTLDAIDVRKSTGLMTGAAWVGWDGNYSFSVDGTRIPVESLAAAALKLAPLSGVLQFTASGTGSFEEPRYDVKLRVADLFAGDEGIGLVVGLLRVRGELLTIDVEAASQRLQASGSGRIAMNDAMDAELTLTFRDTSLDPYLRFFEPRLSPFTNAVAEGTVRVVGELADIDHLVVDARIQQLDLKLFDYRLRNDGPIELSLDRTVAEIRRLRLSGDGTQLEVSGQIGLRDSTIAVQASGDANLGILQGFFRDIRSSGAATLKAGITGSLGTPVFGGAATISNGRIRASSLPSLDAINGRVSFDASGARIEDVKARLGAGEVTIGGSIGVSGFALGEVSLTAVGQQMTLRYPEGFRSIVDADLTLRGTMSALELGGRVTVHDALYSKRFETTPDLFNLGGGGAAAPGAAPVQSFPLRLNVDIHAPQSLRVENNIARIVSSADLTLQGTYDRPVLFGQAEIDRGDIIFEGNRYVVTRGTVGFSNLTRIEPYFDIEAETRVRVPGETYRVTIGVVGTPSKVALNLDSDPPLSQVDILSVLFGHTTDLRDAELRTLNPSAASRAQEDLLKAAATRLVAGSLSAPVGRVFEETLGVDLLIAPSLGSGSDPFASATARVVVGRRLSDRAYLTFTRSLGTVSLGTAARDQIVLEYDLSDKVGCVVTQDSYGTFSIDFRVRHVIF